MKIRIRQRKSSITMFAMPDIAFLLLIFLILTASVDEYGEIQLPQFRFMQQTEFPATLTVNISSGGLTGISGEYMSADSFSAALNQVPQGTVINLVADKNTYYSNIDKTLDLLQSAGLTDIVLIMDDETVNE